MTVMTQLTTMILTTLMYNQNDINDIDVIDNKYDTNFINDNNDIIASNNDIIENNNDIIESNNDIIRKNCNNNALKTKL